MGCDFRVVPEAARREKVHHQLVGRIGSGRRNAFALREAIDELPLSTRLAMLEVAAGDEDLIVGAYTDRGGRVCPVVAAQRRGAREYVGSFPRAWDAFSGARRARPATRRERQILVALLQESVAGEPVSQSTSSERVCLSPVA